MGGAVAVFLFLEEKQGEGFARAKCLLDRIEIYAVLGRRSSPVLLRRGVDLAGRINARMPFLRSNMNVDRLPVPAPRIQPGIQKRILPSRRSPIANRALLCVASHGFLGEDGARA